VREVGGSSGQSPQRLARTADMVKVFVSSQLLVWAAAVLPVCPIARLVGVAVHLVRMAEHSVMPY